MVIDRFFFLEYFSRFLWIFFFKFSIFWEEKGQADGHYYLKIMARNIFLWSNHILIPLHVSNGAHGFLEEYKNILLNLNVFSDVVYASATSTRLAHIDHQATWHVYVDGVIFESLNFGGFDLTIEDIEGTYFEEGRNQS